MKFKILAYYSLIAFSVIFHSCNETPIDPDSNTTTPVIDSLSATKLIIAFGGTEPTIISAYAHGGNLTYMWEVDFGDIIPQNSEATQVSFAGSPCCVGEKEIKCTVTNDKGSDSEIITITILE